MLIQMVLFFDTLGHIHLLVESVGEVVQTII